MIVPIVNIVKETGSDREVLPVSFGKPRFFPVGENAVDRHAGQIDDVADEFVADQKRNDVLAFVKGRPYAASSTRRKSFTRASAPRVKLAVIPSI